MRRILKTVVALTACVSLWVGVAAHASADDLTDRLSALNARIVEFENNEHVSTILEDIAQMRMEVGDAQNLIRAKENSAALGIILRIEARQRYVDSMLQRTSFEELTHQRESDYLDLLEEANELQIEVEATQQRRRSLQENVQAIVDAMNEG